MAAIRFWSVVMLAFAAACAPAAVRAPLHEQPVRNIILLIADGGGIGIWTAASFAEQDLAIGRMPVVGLLQTPSASHKVTDSAAGATAYATGQLATNRTIGVGPPSACTFPPTRDPVATAWPPGCEPLESWFRTAQRAGKAAGLVTTASVVDATPAAFVAHSPNRYWHEAIADQYVEARLDVLLGGGSHAFLGDQRRDGRDLWGEMCAAARCLTSADELAEYLPDDRPLVGLFAPGDMDQLPVRPVSFPAMVQAALSRLSRDPDGFVAVFETEATDNAGHENVSLERATADILDFDRGIGVALDFASRTPGTLVLVTADHETGGFSLVGAGRELELRYTSQSHTAALVPIFAAGPQAERFGGLRRNVEIGRTLLQIVRDW